jgi:predicted double-glycine peptidase
MLQIDFVKQKEFHCGAACLEMVYKYFNLKNLTQTEIFEKWKKFDTNTGNYYISTNDLVSDVNERGFYSELKRFNYLDQQEAICELKNIIDQGYPVIVCQKWNKKNPSVGHFRLVLGIDEEFVYFHDPDKDTRFKNRKSDKYSHKKFLDFWQPTGEFVTGGYGFYIKPLA